MKPEDESSILPLVRGAGPLYEMAHGATLVSLLRAGAVRQPGVGAGFTVCTGVAGRNGIAVNLKRRADYREDRLPDQGDQRAMKDPISPDLRQKAEERLAELSARIVSNLIMVGQIPAPTGEEEARGEYIIERIVELGLEDVGRDATGNVYARRPGTRGLNTIGLFAPLDTLFPAEVDHHLAMSSSRVTGPGVTNDSFAASALLSLAEFFEGWEYPLDNDLLFVWLTGCADQADHEGMRYFLQGRHNRLAYALMLESIELGRLSYFTVGCLRFDLTIQIPTDRAWGDLGVNSATNILADAVTLLLAIELPRRPKTVLNIGLLQGGEGHGVLSTEASLGAELRSESADVLARVEREIDEIAGHLSSYYGCQVDLRKFGRRMPAGLRFNHPMVKTIKATMTDLGIAPSPGPDTAAASLAMAHAIPTTTLALTRGRRAGKESYIEIEPIPLGLLHVILVLHRLEEMLA